MIRMASITKKQRQTIENRIYNVMDTLDHTKTNSEYYKKLFSTMSDEQFYKYISKKYPYKFHINQDIQPTMSDISKACKLVNTELMEKCYLPYLYTNKGEFAITLLILLVYNFIYYLDALIILRISLVISSMLFS